MAIMTYEEYKKQAAKSPETYATERAGTYTTEEQNIDTKYENADAAAKDRAEASITDAKKRYRNQYNANAIQEVLDRNAINERMANMGLTNSGLNATQQTAIALARGNRDASTTANQSQFINDTELALQDIYRQNEEKKQAEKLAAQQSRDDDIANYEAAFRNSYNEYLDTLKDDTNTQNEYTYALYKKYLDDGKYEEAAKIYNELFGPKKESEGGNGVGAISTNPMLSGDNASYANHLYVKTDDTWDGFLGLGNLVDEPYLSRSI